MQIQSHAPFRSHLGLSVDREQQDMLVRQETKKESLIHKEMPLYIKPGVMKPLVVKGVCKSTDLGITARMDQCKQSSPKLPSESVGSPPDVGYMTIRIERFLPIDKVK